MTTYTLGIEEIGDGPTRARVFDTATEAVGILDEWTRGGATISIILRNGQPIDEDTLRADGEAERTIEIE